MSINPSTSTRTRWQVKINCRVKVVKSRERRTQNDGAPQLRNKRRKENGGEVQLSPSSPQELVELVELSAAGAAAPPHKSLTIMVLEPRWGELLRKRARSCTAFISRQPILIFSTAKKKKNNPKTMKSS